MVEAGRIELPSASPLHSGSTCLVCAFNLTGRYPADGEDVRRFCLGFNGSATDMLHRDTMLDDLSNPCP